MWPVGAYRQSVASPVNTEPQSKTGANMVGRKAETVLDGPPIGKALVYVLGVITELKANGLVTTTDPCSALTDAGMAEYHRLRSARYEPTDEQIYMALLYVRKWGESEEKEYKAVFNKG
jgi:hypothetical protein